MENLLLTCVAALSLICIAATSFYFFHKQKSGHSQNELLHQLKADITNSVNQQFQLANSAMRSQLELIQKQLADIGTHNELKHDHLRNAIADHLLRIQEDNNKKLETIRVTVEEKLHDTLEKRLGDSFKIVSERLEQVYKGLGEMQTIAAGVGDLKKVLTNVKTRGIWGEVQLGNIIEQMLTPSQYETNAQVKPNSGERVEFAIKIPNKESRPEFIYLPIDSKFPIEIYYKLVEAQEHGDFNSIELLSKELENCIKQQAKLISSKYICPPYTTDFAIMFLPVEALYAEVLRRPGLIEILQRDYRVVITCPTTLAAIISSLQMGFKTLAIEKHSSEVWKTLATVKTEFVKFADVLTKTRAKLDQASKEIGNAEVRSRAIERHLRSIENDNTSAANNLLIDTIDQEAA